MKDKKDNYVSVISWKHQTPSQHSRLPVAKRIEYDQHEAAGWNCYFHRDFLSANTVATTRGNNFTTFACVHDRPRSFSGVVIQRECNFDSGVCWSHRGRTRLTRWVRSR